MEQPAPIGGKGEQHPYRLAHRPGQMSNGCINADHQIQLGNGCGCIDKTAETGSQLHHLVLLQ
jgi:hypothetical protein